MQIGEEHVALGDLLPLRRLRLFHLDDQLGFLPRIADARAGLLIRGVGRANAATGVGFHHHLVPVRDQLAHRRRREANAVLVRLDFLGNADDHCA